MRVSSIHDLAAAARGRRLELGLSQAELAARTGVSRDWINYFEAGKPTVELILVLRVLEVLGLKLDVSADTGEPGFTDCRVDRSRCPAGRVQTP